MTEKLIKMLESCRHTLTMYNGLLASDQKDMKHAFELNNEKLIDKIDRVLQDAIKHRDKYYATCNGFKNKETASVVLYIENDATVLKNAYLLCQTYMDNDKLANELEFWFEPDSSLVLGSHKMLMYQMQVDAHARVDWLEVAQHLRMKHKEHLRG